VTKFDENYSLYIAKKKGAPKDDFPGLSLASNVKKTNYDRFSLCCFSSCFISKHAAKVATPDPPKLSAPVIVAAEIPVVSKSVAPKLESKTINLLP
jgi:hypothetical protein